MAESAQATGNVVPTGSVRDYFKLHLIVFLWGFTGVLGELIDLPAIELVFYRCAIAAFTLAIILRRHLRVQRIDVIRLFFLGTTIGLHWVLFFLAVKISNVSVCMVGIATVSLWTALLEPILIPGTPLRRDDLAFGALVILAVALIVGSELDQALGFVVAIASAIVAAGFSILNGPLAKRIDHRVITFHEMIGASCFCITCLPISAAYLSDGRGIDLVPSAFEWVGLIVLAVVCTVYAYSEYVELLKRLSVFTINFANNLEPVYGMLLGALLFADYESLGSGFYAGAVAIAGLVLLHTRMTRRKQWMT